LKSPPSGILRADFFNRPAAAVAGDLLGKALVRQLGTRRLSAIITETEAYEGEHDLACHSARGRTARTEVMFGPPGRFYMYRIYGLHWMLNVVTGRIGEAAAVLIRGLNVVNGPARLTAALGIDGSFNGRDANVPAGLWFEEGRNEVAAKRVLRTARIGVAYAGPMWAKRKLRFVLGEAGKR
jgi:DNA-3-methyladenine glycosylase